MHNQGLITNRDKTFFSPPVWWTGYVLTLSPVQLMYLPGNNVM
jgi:hypothetical protein